MLEMPCIWALSEAFKIYYNYEEAESLFFLVKIETKNILKYK